MSLLMTRLVEFRIGNDFYRYCTGRLGGILGSVTAMDEEWTPADISLGKSDQTAESSRFELTVPFRLEVVQECKQFLPNFIVGVKVYRKQDAAWVLDNSGRIRMMEHDIDKQRTKISCNPQEGPEDGGFPTSFMGPHCNLEFGGTDCGVDVTDPEFSVTFNAADATYSGFNVTLAGFDAKPDGFFAGGKLTGGGESAYILGHVGDTITTLTKFRNRTATDARAIKHCARTKAACEDNGNLIRWDGIETVPVRNPIQGVD